MQFRDLKTQYEVLKKDIDTAMIEVAASSAYIMGKQVKELESQLAEYVGVKHCVSCIESVGHQIRGCCFCSRFYFLCFGRSYFF